MRYKLREINLISIFYFIFWLASLLYVTNTLMLMEEDIFHMTKIKFQTKN